APRLFRCGLRRGWAPSETRLSRRSGLVETAARGEYGGLLEAALVVAVLRLVREKVEGADELVKTLLRFGFRRLDGQCTMYDQREVHGHGMVALVDHGLREVERRDVGVLEPRIVEEHLVHTRAIAVRTAERLAHEVLETGAHVVRCQHGVL